MKKIKLSPVHDPIMVCSPTLIRYITNFFWPFVFLKKKQKIKKENTSRTVFIETEDKMKKKLPIGGENQSFTTPMVRLWRFSMVRIKVVRFRCSINRLSICPNQSCNHDLDLLRYSLLSSSAKFFYSICKTNCLIEFLLTNPNMQMKRS